jgi:hypothetical protein
VSQGRESGFVLAGFLIAVITLARQGEINGRIPAIAASGRASADGLLPAFWPNFKDSYTNNRRLDAGDWYGSMYQPEKTRGQCSTCAFDRAGPCGQLIVVAAPYGRFLLRGC